MKRIMRKVTKQSNNWVKLLFIIPVVILVAAVAWFVINNVKINNDPSNENNDSQVSHDEEEDSNNTEYDAYTAISDDDIQRGGGIIELLWDARDPYYGYDNVPIVALVYINSIDGGRNYDPLSGQYTYPQTFGKMTVKEVYKGDIVVGTQVNYARLGGIITYDDYFKGLNEAQQEIIIIQNNGQKPDPDKKYIEEKPMDDISIETGKNYVVFLLLETTTEEYFIQGLQYGLREVKIEDNQIMVLDNTTKEWGSLGSIVRLQ